MRILFVTSNRLGDAVISTGVLDALQRRYPSARFTVVCGPVAAGLFEADPRCERVIVMEKLQGDRHWLALWRRCVRTRWFMVVDLRGSLLGLVLRARRRVIVRGGRRPGRRIDQIGAALGYQRRLTPRVWTSEAQRRQAKTRLPDDAGQRYLAIAPTANWDTKIWPADKFIAVSRHFQKAGVTPVLFYGPGPDEYARARRVAEELPGIIDLGGNQTLGEVAALLARCEGFIGNDSGLMHLSAAIGVPTLGLFGPSRASEYAPTGPSAAFVQAPGPEGQGRMEDLSVEQALSALERLLAPRR